MTMKEYLQMDAQMNARLSLTAECVNSLRLARELKLGSNLCSALYQLIEKVAVMEWGYGTVVDDFSCPDYFVVSSGTRTKKI